MILLYLEQETSVTRVTETVELPKVNPDILNITENDELDYWLSKLVVEVRTKKDPGSVYPPSTLYQLTLRVQFPERSNLSVTLSIPPQTFS